MNSLDMSAPAEEYQGQPEVIYLPPPTPTTPNPTNLAAPVHTPLPTTPPPPSPSPCATYLQTPTPSPSPSPTPRRRALSISATLRKKSRSDTAIITNLPAQTLASPIVLQPRRLASPINLGPGWLRRMTGSAPSVWETMSTPDAVCLGMDQCVLYTLDRRNYDCVVCKAGYGIAGYVDEEGRMGFVL